MAHRFRPLTSGKYTPEKAEAWTTTTTVVSQQPSIEWIDWWVEFYACGHGNITAHPITGTLYRTCHICSSKRRRAFS